VKPFQFSKPASDELTEAVRWDEMRRSGLGSDFYDVIVRTSAFWRWVFVGYVARNLVLIEHLPDGCHEPRKLVGERGMIASRVGECLSASRYK
jgi:hypothetical protein